VFGLRGSVAKGVAGWRGAGLLLIVPPNGEFTLGIGGNWLAGGVIFPGRPPPLLPRGTLSLGVGGNDGLGGNGFLVVPPMSGPPVGVKLGLKGLGLLPDVAGHFGELSSSGFGFPPVFGNCCDAPF
jgi:hypothetical protein